MNEYWPMCYEVFLMCYNRSPKVRTVPFLYEKSLITDNYTIHLALIALNKQKGSRYIQNPRIFTPVIEKQKGRYATSV